MYHIALHPVSVRRFPFFRTQSLENLTPLPMNKWISEQPSPWRKSSKRKSCYGDRAYPSFILPTGRPPPQVPPRRDQRARGGKLLLISYATITITSIIGTVIHIIIIIIVICIIVLSEPGSRASDESAAARTGDDPELGQSVRCAAEVCARWLHVGSSEAFVTSQSLLCNLGPRRDHAWL